MKLNGTTIFLSLLFAVACVCGVVLLWQGVETIIVFNEAKSWPTTKGTITTCKFEDVVNKKGRKAKQLTVKYTYRVNRKLYENDLLSFDRKKSPSYKAQQTIFEKLKGVKQIDVHYDPADPQYAALTCETSGDVYIGLIIAFISLSFAFGIVFLNWPYLKMDKALLKNLKTYGYTDTV